MINRCSSLRKKILDADIALQYHYSHKHIKEELNIFEKAKTNKNVLFSYIKSKQRSKKQVGPFVKEGVLINDTTENILKKQYESVFSIPFDSFKINDPIAFFNDRNDCLYCKREWTHICPSDSNPDPSPR